MVNLITDKKAWSKNQIRKRSEAHIEQIQTHGDEKFINRVCDADLADIRPLTDGERAYRDDVYLPRAVAAGAIAEQMYADNEKLKVVLANEQALRDYVRCAAVLASDYAPAETIEVELGNTIANPAYTELVETHGEKLAVVESLTNEDWQLLAQRAAGAAIDDEQELHVAVVSVVPTIAALTQYVEGLALASVDGRMTLANAKADVLAQLIPPEPEVLDA
ncbi:MAG: hypothetical protein ACPGMR_03245 [Pontibacterium sp.]